ncbi:MAG TPA: hypothetical protein VH877_20370 [Polyangia bacterium]|jgi:hypothetical protein|nr:hypothetical protein [Polyangia bacterium]
MRLSSVRLTRRPVRVGRAITSSLWTAASIAPSATGTVIATGGCDPQVSHTDVVNPGCPGTIARKWKVVDAGVTRTQVQIITVEGPAQGVRVADANDACADIPIAEVRARLCEQRVNLACPVAATWKNRDAYAACVSEAVGLCSDEGLLGKASRGVMVASVTRPPYRHEVEVTPSPLPPRPAPTSSPISRNRSSRSRPRRGARKATLPEALPAW